MDAIVHQPVAASSENGFQSLPTWNDYLAADKADRSAIALHWCRVGHRYIGDGSQAKEAMDLYTKLYSFRLANGELQRPRRPVAYSTNPLDDDRALIISEGEQFNLDAAYDAARDAEGHR